MSPQLRWLSVNYLKKYQLQYQLKKTKGDFLHPSPTASPQLPSFWVLTTPEKVRTQILSQYTVSLSQVSQVMFWKQMAKYKFPVSLKVVHLELHIRKHVPVLTGLTTHTGDPEFTQPSTGIYVKQS